MKVYYQIRNSYGMDRIYPIGDNAEHFAKIAGTKTLSESNLQTIREMGIETVQVTAHHDTQLLVTVYRDQNGLVVPVYA